MSKNAQQHIFDALNCLPDEQREEVTSRLRDLALTGCCEDYRQLWLSTQSIFLLSVSILELMGLDNWTTRPVERREKPQSKTDLAGIFKAVFG